MENYIAYILLTRGLVLIMLLFVYMLYSRTNCNVAKYFRNKSRWHLTCITSVYVCLPLCPLYISAVSNYLSVSVSLISLLSPVSRCLCSSAVTKNMGVFSCCCVLCYVCLLLEGVPCVSGGGSNYLLARRHPGQ